MSAFDRFKQRAFPVLRREIQRIWAIALRSLRKYDETDGEQRAASFAYYAFFAMFPLIILLITIGTTYFGSQITASSEILENIRRYLPLEPQDVHMLTGTIDGVVQSRKSAGVIAFFVLAWSALRFFQALVRGVNRAWGTKEYSWWRLPIKNAFMLAILTSALLLGIVAPAVLKQVETFYWEHSLKIGSGFGLFAWAFQVAKNTLPALVLFYGLSMFYKFAPRRRTAFREVWSSALFVTLALEVIQRLFVLYTRNVSDFNALYGTFGTVVALLLWIYLSGSIIILGGCVAAARYEIDLRLSDQAESSFAR